jgi:hypothetical protein
VLGGSQLADRPVAMLELTSGGLGAVSDPLQSDPLQSDAPVDLPPAELDPSDAGLGGVELLNPTVGGGGGSAIQRPGAQLTLQVRFQQKPFNMIYYIRGIYYHTRLVEKETLKGGLRC